MLLRLASDIHIIGDTHGQLLDVCTMIDRIGPPPTNRYIFLGDYVDRGQLGIETIWLHVYLLRGNHESPTVNKVYGFFDEVTKVAKMPESTWLCLTGTFACLPIAGLIEPHNIFCVHGGLSPYLKSFDELDAIKRPCDVKSAGVICDLLWSDPVGFTNGWSMSQRRIAFGYGKDVISEFCHRFNVSMIVRGHEVQRRGYSVQFDGRLVSLFSAPNYNNSYNNDAAVLHVAMDGTLSVTAFRADTPTFNMQPVTATEEATITDTERSEPLT